MPWSGFWDRNYFADSAPIMAGLMRSPYVRGAVSGIGVVSLLAGLADLAAMLGWRRQ